MSTYIFLGPGPGPSPGPGPGLGRDPGQWDPGQYVRH